MTLLVRQSYRGTLVDHALIAKSVFRKKSRIVAVVASEDFIVETDRGPMTGKAGDWIVANHPDDDPNSDLWTISAERMAATYERVEE